MTRRLVNAMDMTPPPATPYGVERAQTAYAVYRGGFRGSGECPVPHWDDAPSWVRDAVICAYLQGTLDAKFDSQATASQSS